MAIETYFARATSLMKLQNKNYHPLVSVIMNCYNGEKYLAEALDSVLNQTYTNWEIIFWDNKSTDGTQDIVKSYEDKRIKYFQATETTDLYCARNYAYERCKGELIAFLDVDDKWDTTKLEKQVDCFVDKNVDFVCTNFWVLKDKKKIWTFNKILRVNEKGDLIQQILSGNFIAVMTVLVRKSAIDRLPFAFNDRYHVIGDLDLWLRLILNGSRLKIIKDKLAYLRFHDNNETNKNILRMINELKDLEMLLHGKLERNSVSALQDTLISLQVGIFLQNGEFDNALTYARTINGTYLKLRAIVKVYKQKFID